MSQLHMVSEADKQNNPCFVCVLLGVLREPHGAAVLGPSHRTHQGKSQLPCHLAALSSTNTHTHTPHNNSGHSGGREDGPENIRGAQGRHLY